MISGLAPRPSAPFNQNRFHYNWHWNWDYGNGDIGNQGIHQMDIARWALNKTLPLSSLSLGGRYGYKDDGQTANTQLAIYDFGDAPLLFEVRGLPTPALMGVAVGNIIYGTEGFVAFSSEDDSAVLAFDNQGKKTKTFKGSGNHFANFLTAVRSRSQSDLNAPILEGHYSSGFVPSRQYQLSPGRGAGLWSAPRRTGQRINRSGRGFRKVRTAPG